ncbi:MAG TPA: DUF2950 domain-containing protein [Candidatus Methylomirabilis sp.]|nr:DUF2950 domain-containing protein [Candidatus Methylomirabilis sp.]
MKNRKRNDIGGIWRTLAVLAVVAVFALPAAPLPASGAAQRQFDSPEHAVDALIAAVRSGRTADLLAIFGPRGKSLVESGDAVADKNGRARFVASYDEGHSLTTPSDGKITLVLGKDHWPFPIPLVKAGKVWHFDTAAGAEEILNRRIGRNELSAIEVCRAYVDAQREYSSKDRNNDGFREYAQHFASHPNQHDGLYWPTKSGEEPSPMGALVARARDEGYESAGTRTKREPYHGYYYRILKRQGSHALGGAHDYIADDHMIGGFALVAFPAQYGASGVMTFIVNQDGVVYQKNLGPDTERIAREMKAYDPDPSWKAN